MPMRLIPLCSARAKQAVLRRISSNTLPRRAASFSDGIPLGFPLVAYPMAKLDSVCPPENSQPAQG
jgi:hypothetical protein